MQHILTPTTTERANKRASWLAGRLFVCTVGIEKMSFMLTHAKNVLILDLLLLCFFFLCARWTLVSFWQWAWVWVLVCVRVLATTLTKNKAVLLHWKFQRITSTHKRFLSSAPIVYVLLVSYMFSTYVRLHNIDVMLFFLSMNSTHANEYVGMVFPSFSFFRFDNSIWHIA